MVVVDGNSIAGNYSVASFEFLSWTEGLVVGAAAGYMLSA